MKIAHISDIHLDERRGDSGEGLSESVERLIWIGNDAKEAGAEIMLVAGDTFHNAKTSAAERNAAIKVYQSWAEHCCVVVVKGNSSHDGPGEIAFLSALKTKHEIAVFERPGEYVTTAGDVIACLPFPEKQWLAARVEAGQDVSQVAAQALRSILLGWRAKFEDCPGARILLGHVELGAAIADSGQPMVGRCFIEMSEGDLLDAGADYGALGHIHVHQILGDGRLCYSGSVRQVTFGESPPRGYCLVDVERGEKPVIEHRQAPGRELITVEAQWVGTELGPFGESIEEINELWTEGGPLDKLESVPSGAIVRLKYHVSDSDRKQAAKQAERAMQRWLDAGVHSVKLDPQVKVTYRVRSEAIQKARTNEERLEAWWGDTSNRPKREKQIKDKLRELEQC